VPDKRDYRNVGMARFPATKNVTYHELSFA
jgi:hypothetical protein